MSTDFAFTTQHQDTTAGGTKDICLTANAYSVGLVVAAILQASLIIIGNLLVLVVLCRYPPKKFTVLNWLLGHLATADLIIGAITLWWFGISQELAIPLSLNDMLALNGVGMVAIVASFEGLAMIALDRYLLILHTLRYFYIVTKKRLLIALAIMWLVPIIIHLVIPLSGWSCVNSCDCRIYNSRPDDNSCSEERCSQIHPPLTKLQLLLASVMSFLIFCITVALYVTMFYGIRKHSKETQIMLNVRQRISKLNKKDNTSSTAQFSEPNSVPGATESNPDNAGQNNSVESTQRGNFLPVVSTTDNLQITHQDFKLPKSRTNNIADSGTNTREIITAKKRKAFKTRDVTVMKSMFMIMSIFSITTLPLLLCLMYTHANNYPSYRKTVSYLSQVAILNSLVNPFLYFWRIPTMRKGLIQLLHLQTCHPTCVSGDRR